MCRVQGWRTIVSPPLPPQEKEFSASEDSILKQSLSSYFLLETSGTVRGGQVVGKMGARWAGSTEDRGYYLAPDRNNDSRSLEFIAPRPAVDD